MPEHHLTGSNHCWPPWAHDESSTLAYSTENVMFAIWGPRTCGFPYPLWCCHTIIPRCSSIRILEISDFPHAYLVVQRLPQGYNHALTKSGRVASGGRWIWELDAFQASWFGLCPRVFSKQRALSRVVYARDWKVYVEDFTHITLEQSRTSGSFLMRSKSGLISMTCVLRISHQFGWKQSSTA